ncbi:MAG: exodeoxyribonuclease I [Aeromonas sp.]
MTEHSGEPTFYFHDYETFGIHPAKDRPAQFAGVRTDRELNVIGEPLLIYCRPPADYLPTPEACLVTGITPQTAAREGLCEAEFIAQIHAQFATPNTCVLGYNTIRFDDEVTRNSLYRNFYDPYAYAWQNNNSRWDLIDMLRTCYALRPDGIEWPLDDEGKPSFRLERLTAANGIDHGNAHDALADVLATIELAKLVRRAQPKLFEYFFQLRHKNNVKQLIDIVKPKPLVHVSGMFSPWQGCASYIAPLAWHPSNPNALIVADLNADLTPLVELSADEICERLYQPRAERGDKARIALKLVHINKCPILAPAQTLTSERAQMLGIDGAQCRESLNLICQQPVVREKAVAVFAKPFSGERLTDPDLRLYDGFFSAADKKNLDRVRGCSPDQLAALEIKFIDPRLPQMLFRYRARNWPHTLSEQELGQWRRYCQEKLTAELPGYMENFEQLCVQEQSNERSSKILKQLLLYLQAL